MEKLTLEIAKEQVDKIYKVGLSDDAGAHCMEDAIYLRFIKDFSSGNIPYDEAILIAKEILRTDNMDFERWYA